MNCVVNLLHNSFQRFFPSVYFITVLHEDPEKGKSGSS